MKPLKLYCIASLTWLVFSTIVSAQPPPIDDVPPQRIVSMNLCADQLMLLLADPEQIQALSHLSHETGASYFLKKAQQYPTVNNLAEDILPYRPDLVIAGEFGGVATVNLLEKLAVRVEKLPLANGLDDLFANIRYMGDLLGHPQRAEAVIQDMQQRLADLPPPPEQRPIAAVYDPNGYTVGKQTLRGEMIHRAGWQNAGDLLGISGYGVLSLESIVRLAPDALVESPYTLGTWSRGEALSRHPALRKSAIKPHIITLPSRMTICGGPWTVDIIERLQQERLTLQANTE